MLSKSILTNGRKVKVTLQPAEKQTLAEKRRPARYLSPDLPVAHRSLPRRPFSSDHAGLNSADLKETLFALMPL